MAEVAEKGYRKNAGVPQPPAHLRMLSQLSTNYDSARKLNYSSRTTSTQFHTMLLLEFVWIKMSPKDHHHLDDSARGEYLVTRLPSLKLPIVSTKIGYVRKNPTYFVDDVAWVCSTSCITYF